MNPITVKVLKKAIDKKDHNFLAMNMVEQLLEHGWDHDDIRTLAEKLQTACSRS